ncbi:protein FAM161A-like [Lagopus muta]|uniref:protein FAM161A-like n=1 Tax=Lagopus muta TaxID=64668 RepID=UPI00209F5768|nr:protein FAM161A-like [Lagopus muta]
MPPRRGGRPLPTPVYPKGGDRRAESAASVLTATAPSSSVLRYWALRLRAERPRLSPPDAVRPRLSTLRRQRRAAMEAPHGAGPLPTARLRAAVQPHCRPPSARSQRGSPHSAQGELGAEPGPGSEQPLTPGCDTQMGCSKVGSSNQEYYLKLEELKNAHLETMAKLESMYRNKLYLQGVQPLERNNANSATSKVCCRPTWEKSAYQPLSLPRSFSDSSISDPLGSAVSGGSERELSSEDSCSETGSLLFAKERIARMWDGFSVDDYLPPRKHSLPTAAASRTTRKQKAWSPKITVPKPFQMTIREARRKEQNVKSKSQIEMENNLLKKQLEEEAECQKKFRATPVPAAVFLPLYHEIVQRNEERRKSVKERSKLRLLASQKPFKFIEREKQRDEIRRMQLRDLSTPEKKTKPFKAKPVPRYVYSPSVRDKLQEEELYREIRIRMRAEELLRNASLPTSRLAPKDVNKKKKHKCAEPKEMEHKPKIQPRVPDFDRLHQKFQKRLRQKQQVKHLTVCEPFHLRTPYIASNKGKVLRDIQEDEERLKETRWPYASPRRKPQTRQSSANSPLLGSGESKSPRVTQASQRRLQALRNSHEEKRRLEEQQKRNRTKQKQRTKKLQKIVMTRAEANDPHQSLAQVSESKLKAFRNSSKQRMQEYWQELQEMEERVKQRPLLLERVTQSNARIAAEKYYSNRLRALGVCPDFVSKKGQTTNLLECYTAEDFDAKERAIKGTVEERELFEEANSISPQSEQSFEEEKRTGIRTPSWDAESAEREEEEKTQASPQVQQPHCAEETRSSPTSNQHCEEEEQKEEKEEEEAKAGVLLGHSLEEENEEEEDGSRPSSQSDRSHEQQEESQSDHEAEGAFQYEDEEYESDDSEEKPSDDEAD